MQLLPRKRIRISNLPFTNYLKSFFKCFVLLCGIVLTDRYKSE